MEKRKIYWIAGIVGLAVIALISYIFLSKKETSSTSNKITITYAQLRISTPILVAEQQGFFKEVGLDVTLKPSPTGQTNIADLVAGATDAAGYSALPIIFNAITKTKKQLVFLTALYENNEHPITRLIVNPNANITSIKDLKNKRIGILNTKAYEVWLKLILEENGLDIDRDGIVIQEIAPENQGEAIKTKSVDALLTNDPAATKILSKKLGIELTPSIALVPKYTKMNDFYFGTFCVSKKYAIENPGNVKKLSLALDMAIDYITKNPQKCYEALNIDPTINERFGDLVQKYPPSFYKKTDQVSKDDLKAIYDYYRTNNIVLENVDLTDLQYK
jgi:ABC-type nitrate/sulfonate/bicarbonate transport system substrate-binding protein